MRRLLVTVSVVTLIAVGCGGGGSTKPPVSLAGETNDHGTKTAKDGLEVETDDFYFNPTFITATAGQKFTVQLKNDGTARHTFTSPNDGVDLELPPGASRTVTLTAPPTGSVEFHCRFHQSQGMQGAVYVK
jgi:plastocyanin